MEIEFSKGKIVFDKELSDLDRFVLDFVDILNKGKIKYVIVSGYVVLLFGRPRATEDVDILTEHFDFNKFEALVSLLKNSGFEIMNSPDVSELYYEFLKKSTAIRIFRGNIYPNIELKFAHNDLNMEALKNPLKIIVNKQEFLISPLEQQISYKLYLGSDKDVQDAKYLFQLFKDKLDIGKIIQTNKLLKVENKSKLYLGV